MSLPNYFYTVEHPMRWYDEFADPAPHIIQPQDLNLHVMRRKHARNEAYSKWLASFFVRDGNGFAPLLKGKQMIWQVIRVLSSKHSENNRKDWWGNYQDCVFRVFVEPETVYDQVTGEHKQWYLLSPEDSYMVNRHEIESASGSLPVRETNGRERFLSADKRLRRARLIPVECCKHMRHETTGGALPEGL